MKQIEISRDNVIINMLADNNTSIKFKAVVDHDGWSRDRRFRNICLEKVRFIFMNKEYVMDHIWIQTRDMKDGTIYDHIGQEIEIIGSFYRYRNDITRNTCGLTVYRHRPVK